MSPETLSTQKETQLGDLLTEAQIIPDLRASNRWEAIDELINHLVEVGTIKPEHRDAIIAVVKKRECSMSTGIGFGIGIPHATTELVPDLVAALGRSKGQVDFEALDGKPVTLVVLLLVPRGKLPAHLHTLANMTRLFKNTQLRCALEGSPDAGAILRALRLLCVPN